MYLLAGKLIVVSDQLFVYLIDKRQRTDTSLLVMAQTTWPVASKFTSKPLIVLYIKVICFWYSKYYTLQVSALHIDDMVSVNSVLADALGPDSIYRWHLTSIGNPIMEIRQSYDRLISTMGFPILVRCHLYIESGPRYLTMLGHQQEQSWQST